MKIYQCSHCKNTVYFLKNVGVPVQCCGETMTELVPCSTDAATEKHVPVVAINGQSVHVTVGSVMHPMLPEHHIAWIALETNLGVQIHHLDVAGEPSTTFALAEGETVIAAYEYCNLHGLWKA